MPRTSLAVLVPLLCVCVLSPASAEKVPLRIVSATDTTAISDLIAGFEKKYPDITVRYDEFNTIELHDFIRTHYGKPSFDGDIVISSAMDLQVSLVNDGLAHTFTPSSVSDLPDWSQWRHELYGFTYEPAAFVYNVKAFEARSLPRTHSDLASLMRDDPRFFESRVGTYDVRRSGIGYLYATQDVIRGHQAFRLTESFARANGQSYCCTSDMLQLVTEGKLVFAYNVIGSYALAYARHDPNVGILFPTDYNLVMTRTAFILKSSKRKTAAQNFIDFLLSVEGQSSITQNSDLIPIRLDVAKQHDDIRRHKIGEQSFMPIKLGVGLLTYLDKVKKSNFIKHWEMAVSIPHPH